MRFIRQTCFERPMVIQQQLHDFLFANNKLVEVEQAASPRAAEAEDIAEALSTAEASPSDDVQTLEK